MSHSFAFSTDNSQVNNKIFCLSLPLFAGLTTKTSHFGSMKTFACPKAEALMAQLDTFVSNSLCQDHCHVSVVVFPSLHVCLHSKKELQWLSCCCHANCNMFNVSAESLKDEGLDTKNENNHQNCGHTDITCVRAFCWKAVLANARCCGQTCNQLLVAQVP